MDDYSMQAAQEMWDRAVPDEPADTTPRPGDYPDEFDAHESGQLRIGVEGDQRSLFGLDDSDIPAMRRAEQTLAQEPEPWTCEGQTEMTVVREDEPPTVEVIDRFGRKVAEGKTDDPTLHSRIAATLARPVRGSS